MKESFSQDRKIDELKPKMATLESLDHLDVTPDETVVTAKLDGEFTLLAYDRNGESYTLNKWGHHRSDFPALNQLVEKINQTQYKHVEFLCELYAFDTKPLKLPQFISLIKGEHQDLNKIHIAIWDLLSIDGKPITEPFDWKMQEIETWLKGCTHVAVVPHILPRTLQDVKDLWNNYVVEQGYEGLVIHNRNRTYKIKPTLEVDAVVIGLNKKTSYGKELDLFQQGQVTSIKLALMQPDRTFVELSDCASGITADLRTVLWKLMSFKVSEDHKTVHIKPVVVCTLQYTDTFPKRREALKFVEGEGYKSRGYVPFVSLRHPRLIRFRPDKTVNPQDLRLTQIPENRLPKPEPQRTSKTEHTEVKEMEKVSQIEAPRIVKPLITMNPNDRFEDLLQKLYVEGWRVNSDLKGNTIEEAVENQAKVFPCIEFQPVKLLDGRYIAFHRTSVEEWLKHQGEKTELLVLEPTPKPEPKTIKVKGEGADAYWQRNSTCVDYLKKLILTKMSEEELRKKTLGCHNIEGVTEEFMDDAWKKVEHPEWFGHSDYYIKPYLALCIALELGDQAYKFLNEGTAFPHKPPEEATEVTETPKIEQDLPCETEECDRCPDPCNDEERCGLGVRKSMTGKDEACLTCQVRDCEALNPTKTTQKQTTLF